MFGFIAIAVMASVCALLVMAFKRRAQVVAVVDAANARADAISASMGGAVEQAKASADAFLAAVKDTPKQ